MITLNSVITNLNSYISDKTEDRVTNSERFEAVTEATTWLLEELGNEHMVETSELGFFDTINYYKITNSVADLLVGGDLRRPVGSNYVSFSRKSPRELSEEIASKSVSDPSWAIERRDGDSYIVVNADTSSSAMIIDDASSITGWAADDDASNLTIDTNEFVHGGSSINFDISGATTTASLIKSSFGTLDLSSYEDLGSFIFDVYIPDATEITSMTFLWGDSASVYWSATVTTDFNGNAFADGWNTIKITWRNATATGSPDSGSVAYLKYTITYDAAQAADTDFRLDYLRIVNPETLTFHYISWNVGKDSTGASITAYTATTDVPFYSGTYDNYKYAVAHKAASLLYYSSLRNIEQGQVEESESIKALKRYVKNFESSKIREVKSFKIMGNNLRRGSRIRTR